MSELLPAMVDLSADSVRAVARALAELRDESPFSIPLDSRNEPKIRARWGWTCDQVRDLNRRVGLPLKTIPGKTAQGVRYVLVVADVDEWVRRQEPTAVQVAASPGGSERARAGEGARAGVGGGAQPRGEHGSVFPFPRRRRRGSSGR